MEQHLPSPDQVAQYDRRVAASGPYLEPETRPNELQQENWFEDATVHEEHRFEHSTISNLQKIRSAHKSRHVQGWSRHMQKCEHHDQAMYDVEDLEDTCCMPFESQQQPQSFAEAYRQTLKNRREQPLRPQQQQQQQQQNQQQQQRRPQQQYQPQQHFDDTYRQQQQHHHQ